MLDTLVLHVPLRAEFVVQNGSLFSVLGDVADYQVRAVPSYLKRELDGSIIYGDLRHPYESVPSSYSGMAIKFNAVNVANTHPYVSLNASVKILQGHNICGGESVKNLASEMLALLREYYPHFFACLDLAYASIARLDSTFSVEVEHERYIQPCIRFLGNISNGQRKADKDKRDFYNTVYWGGKTSRLGGAKVYGKHCEVMKDVNELQASVAKGFISAQKKLDVFTPELLNFSKRLLRFESTTKRRQLDRLGYPDNLWLFIRHQQMDKGVLAKLWRIWFLPILAALDGDVELENADDGRVYSMLCNSDYLVTHCSLRTRGPVLTRANSAFNFYQLVKSEGYDDMKLRFDPSTFHRQVRSLESVGFSRAMLQNLKHGSVVSFPMSEIIKFDFTRQSPSGYTPVISSHINEFDYYLQPRNAIKGFDYEGKN